MSVRRRRGPPFFGRHYVSERRRNWTALRVSVRTRPDTSAVLDDTDSSHSRVVFKNLESLWTILLSPNISLLEGGEREKQREWSYLVGRWSELKVRTPPKIAVLVKTWRGLAPRGSLRQRRRWHLGESDERLTLSLSLSLFSRIASTFILPFTTSSCNCRLSFLNI